ncbi:MULTISPECIES: magnesium transporter [Rhodococcus]|uniref:magnesium transporter n=1 Tax=Rhodococcus TaxID=1827 RepID=UPI001E2F4FDA|nr:magnesium transporter [Rhodococcus pyridinivorans]MCD2116721.1 magnesium transporter [Rhodococcus pyridinivorans]MCZ4625335.1 magnesium transporter [Rhodococcus pyridinivorans]MCZ4646545.1 magnesium transporter [Rhodococcus pyridinivorans]MDJ0482383.1 magnesium transporter [Rhodococcus pyridinivorans]MDV7252902.1 magnesium transporter [Rhodococcus pyridinivorans]
MSNQGNDVLTVFVASPGPARGVRDVLRDLSAADLVGSFVWLEDSDVGGPGAQIPAAEIERGVDHAITLQDVLASRHYDLVRLCVLVPSGADAVPVRLATETMLAELLSSNSGGARCVRMRVLLRRPADDQSSTATAALAGWHNLLVAPEDSRGPGMGHESLVSTTDPVDVGRQAGPVIAGITGLWTDVDHAPFDDEPVLPGNPLRVVRSFYRRLDTSHAEHRLHAELLEFDGQLPLPRDAGTAVLYVDDVPGATRQMAHAVWKKHGHLLTSARVTAPPKREQRAISLFDALKMTGRFLLAVLKNAPSVLFDRVVFRASTSIANAAQRALFGSSPAAFSVVVGGVDGDGNRVSWTAYEAASRQIGAALDEGKGTSQPAPDLSALWRDYVRGALTLADASERSAGLPPVQVGAHRAVLRSAADIVPGPGDDFTDIPGVVSATSKTHIAEAADILGIEEFRTGLQALEHDPVIGLDARRTGAAVKAWAGRTRHSYAVAFGSMLTARLSADIAEASTLLTRMKSMETLRDPAEEAADVQKRMFRRVHIATLISVLIGGVAGVLAWKEVISWWWGGPIIALCVLGWGVAVTFICQRSQQHLENMLAEREAATAAHDADRVNLRAALREIEVLTGAYRQYLSWSRALGAFLARPLGVPEHVLTIHRRVEWGLPRHSAIGSGNPDDGKIARVADQLRQDLFTVGWLTEPWDTVSGGAGAALGGSARDVEREPSLLATKVGAGSGSPLDDWSLMFYRGQVQSTGAAVIWQRAMGELTGPRTNLARDLLDVIEFRVDGNVRRAGVDEFLAGVGRPTEGGFLDRTAFSDTATMRGASAVVGEIPTINRVGCGLVAVTTQYTEGISAEDLAGPTTSTSAPFDLPEVPDFAMRPAQREELPAQRPGTGSYVAPAVDGINF